MTKTRGIIGAGDTFRFPAGLLAGLTLESVSGPAFSVTEAGAVVGIGATFGTGAVTFQRGADGNVQDSGFVLSEPDSGSGNGLSYQGTVDSLGTLAGKPAVRGNAYSLTTNNHLYVYDGSTWVDVGLIALQGPKGDPGATGAPGPAGIGVPEGGSQGQVLTRTSTGTVWANPTGGASSGGTTGGILSPNLAVGVRNPPTVTAKKETAPESLYVATWEMTPLAPVNLNGLRDTGTLSAAHNYRAVVWRGDTLIGSGNVIAGGGQNASTFSSPVALAAGTQYVIGWQTTDDGHGIATSAVPATYSRFQLGKQVYSQAPDFYPDLYAYWSGSYPAFELLTDQPAPTVLGPLSPTDFPVSSVADAPTGSGFMVVDDAAKTASLYWKFSNGTTKKLDLA